MFVGGRGSGGGMGVEGEQETGDVSSCMVWRITPNLSTALCIVPE